MRAVLQRVRRAQVSVDGEVTGKIGPGLLALVAVHRDDQQSDVSWMRRKLINLRFFDDAEGKLNLSLSQVGGKILAVSQFTLYGDCRKGNRPSYTRSAGPDKAQALYDQLVEDLRAGGVPVETGVFQASMQVELVNDGPVTLMLDSRQRL
ncbi:MAG TPA: D-aminoacyl-tRNA deacylase [Acidobacteriota bacterium]|nr:D-aminoacyl-tRNA deacylase [Acidobacteriota bacterium]